MTPTCLTWPRQYCFYAKGHNHVERWRFQSSPTNRLNNVLSFFDLFVYHLNWVSCVGGFGWAPGFDNATCFVRHGTPGALLAPNHPDYGPVVSKLRNTKWKSMKQISKTIAWANIRHTQDGPLLKNISAASTTRTICTFFQIRLFLCMCWVFRFCKKKGRMKTLPLIPVWGSPVRKWIVSTVCFHIDT